MSLFVKKKKTKPDLGLSVNDLPCKPRPACSCAKFGKEPVTQELYRCLECKMGTCATICRGCAAFCHSGHKITRVGVMYGICGCGAGSKNCHCFLMHPISGDEDFEPGEYRQCRYLSTRKSHESGMCSECIDCGQGGGQVSCLACMKMCHRGHTSGRTRPGNFFCDCGDQPERYGCILQPEKEVEEHLYCNRFQTNVNPEIASRCAFYMCQTCGITVCWSCKRKCHAGHNVANTGKMGGTCACPADMCQDVLQKEPAA